MPLDKNTVRRHPERGRYEQDVVRDILDAAFLCHVGFVQEGQPFVIPTLYCRVENTVYLHGSPLSRMLQTLASSAPLCITVTLLDGIVLARSAFNSSINYRSAVIFGTGRLVEAPDEQEMAMRALVEHVVAGRSAEARMPSWKELRVTSIVAVQIDQASAKVRTGPPVDKRNDLSLDIWAGVIPLHLQPGEPIPDPTLPGDMPVPSSVLKFLSEGGTTS